MKTPLRMLQVVIILSVIVSEGMAQLAEPLTPFSIEEKEAWYKIGAIESWFSLTPWGELVRSIEKDNASWPGFFRANFRGLAIFGGGLDPGSLNEVAVPSVPFALSIDQATSRELRILLRFRDNLQALDILHSPGLNAEKGGYDFLKPLSQLRAVSLAEPSGDELFKAISGHRFIDSLRVRGPFVTDAGLTELAKMTQLRMLSIVEAEQITPEGMKEIAKLSNLRSLKLDGSAINDESLAHLTALTDLQHLDLSNTRITDAGVESLSQFRRLETLALGVTKLRPEALGRLKIKTVTWTPFYTSGARQSERDGVLAAQTIWSGRTLEQWFQDVTARIGDEDVQLRADEAKRELIMAAAFEPDVCRVALQHVGRGDRAVEDRLHRILVANRENARLAACERLSDEADDAWADPWCINYLREQEDTSLETIAALVACLHSKTKSGKAGDGIPKQAAVRLGEIGLPALDAILSDRLRGTHARRWSHGSLEMMGVQATEGVLEYSLAHPEDFLVNVLATFCQDNAAEVAPKLLAVLTNEKHAKHHTLVLATLATAGETDYRDYKRIKKIDPDMNPEAYYRDPERMHPRLNAEGVVSAALPFLRQKETYVSSMKIIVGWRPHPEGTKEQVVTAFIAGHDDWLSGVKTLGTLDEIPVEVAGPLFQLHEKVPPAVVSHWQIAIGKLSAEGKEKIKPALRASARTSPAAAIGLATVDPSDQTRREVQAILNEMKQDETLRQRIEAFLRQARNL